MSTEFKNDTKEYLKQHEDMTREELLEVCKKLEDSCFMLMEKNEIMNANINAIQNAVKEAKTKPEEYFDKECNKDCDRCLVRAEPYCLMKILKNYIKYEKKYEEVGFQLHLANNKISEIEKIEDEIGMPLDVWWKITKGTRIEFFNTRTNQIEDRELYLLDEFVNFKDKAFFLIDYDYDDEFGGDIETIKFEFKDYKKTWWFKEDNNISAKVSDNDD